MAFSTPRLRLKDLQRRALMVAHTPLRVLVLMVKGLLGPMRHIHQVMVSNPVDPPLLLRKLQHPRTRLSRINIPHNIARLTMAWRLIHPVATLFLLTQISSASSKPSARSISKLASNLAKTKKWIMPSEPVSIRLCLKHH